MSCVSWSGSIVPQNVQVCAGCGAAGSIWVGLCFSFVRANHTSSGFLCAPRRRNIKLAGERVELPGVPRAPEVPHLLQEATEHRDGEHPRVRERFRRHAKTRRKSNRRRISGEESQAKNLRQKSYSQLLRCSAPRFCVFCL